jgi:hypothetical protein
MAASDYHFITAWTFDATTPDEVYDVIGAPEELPRWWPSVYLGVRVVEPGGDGGVGKVVDLHTKGWLPYTLRWRLRVAEAERPRRSLIEAQGDFVGRGIWTFDARPDGGVRVTYDWRIRAAKPLLRALSFLLKPVFAANHRWAMARGEESLRLELRRRHAPTADERARVPAPPPPTWPHRRRA